MHDTPGPPSAPTPPAPPAPVFVLTRDPDPYADAGAIVTWTLRAGVTPLLGADDDTADRIRRAIARAVEAVRRTPDESPVVVARIAHAIDQIAGALRAHERATRELQQQQTAPAPAPAPSSNGPGRPEPRRPRPLDTPPQNPRPVAVIDF